MDRFLLVIHEEAGDEQSSRAADLVNGAFEYRLPVGNGAWMIASKKPLTCSDVVDRLGFANQEDDVLRCLVAKLGEFNGWAEEGVWEKLAMWEGMGSD